MCFRKATTIASSSIVRTVECGRIPDDWKDKPKKLAQKDRDARWTLKRAKACPAKDGEKAKVEIAIPVFGYKNHVSIDRAHGFVRRFAVTSAAAHDGARLPEVLDKSNTASAVWADTAYRSQANETHMEKRLRFESSLPPAARFAADGVAGQGQCGEIESALGGGDGLRRAETSLRSVRAHHRRDARQGENRSRQHRLQCDAFHLADDPACSRLTATPHKRQSSGAHNAATEAQKPFSTPAPPSKRFFEVSDRSPRGSRMDRRALHGPSRGSKHRQFQPPCSTICGRRWPAPIW